MSVIVFGASGYLGRYVYAEFRNHYRNICEVIGTYYAHQTDETLIHFDIDRDEIESLNLSADRDVRYAVICAAEPRFDACEVKRGESFQLNVTSTIKLIEKLKQMGYNILFCSTDSVYDGSKGNYQESDCAVPVNEYGRMKLWVEQYIMKHYPVDCIFRLSKLIGNVDSSSDTLQQWKNMARNKEDIYCIKNNFFSPVDVEDVAKCIELACRKKISGIYNVCGNKSYSRMELCISFLNFLNLQTNIYEKDLEDFGFYAKRPLNVGMSNQKVTDVLGYKFKDMTEIYTRYVDR